MSSWKAESLKACDIVEKIKNKEISVPQYQRGQVWKSTQEEKLIDSIKNNFPFGSILLFKKSEKEYHLIDGLQRCTTLYRYLENPAKFFNAELDIDNNVINSIYNFINIKNNEQIIKDRIKLTISDWVRNNHKNLSEIDNIRSNKCAREIAKIFPTITPESEEKIDDLLAEMFQKYKQACKEINETQVPAIVYSGDESQLPEVFNRINSKGTALTKYQILSATWVIHEVKITDKALLPIINYVESFFSTIEQEGFNLVNYNSVSFKKQQKVNLYQLLFGFGKLISDRYPHLFSKSKNQIEAESCGFNLVNACLANKNSNLKALPSVLSNQFNSDNEINLFLQNIINSIDEVDKILSPYIKFKMNSRDSIHIYHTELQICSLISNIFIKRYVDFVLDENSEIIGRKILIDRSKQGWDKFKTDLRKLCFLNYFIDIINNSWKGSGDKLLDEVSTNSDYYIRQRSKEDLNSLLDLWFANSRDNRLEYLKINDPNLQEKLFLSVIYSHKFTAADQLDGSKYDIEHLCPKNQLKSKLSKFQSNSQGRLPISSIGNICLLPEWDNRKKKDKTIYQDNDYLLKIENKIEIIQSKYTFTSPEMLNWIEKDYQSFDELNNDYLNFINSRFKSQKDEVIKTLFKQ